MTGEIYPLSRWIVARPDMGIKSTRDRVENIMTAIQKVNVSTEICNGCRDELTSAYELDAKTGAHSRTPSRQEMYEDARGFTYQSVRFCDLDRLRDK